MFDHIRDDLQTYDGRWWSQGVWVMLVYRFGRWTLRLRPRWLGRALTPAYRLLNKLIQIATGVDLPREAKVGRHFVIDHFGEIIISRHARFGDNCRVRNGVSVGARRAGEPWAPTLGNNVDIGTGAKLMGRITVGDNVLVGANAVVRTDVPANSIAAGIPATIQPRGPRPPR